MGARLSSCLWSRVAKVNDSGGGWLALLVFITLTMAKERAVDRLMLRFLRGGVFFFAVTQVAMNIHSPTCQVSRRFSTLLQVRAGRAVE